MPGLVSVRRGTRAPTLPPDADFGICVIGAASKSPLAAGKVSAPYGNTSAIAADYGVGDAVDAAMQACKRTNANPAPMGVCIYRTPSTTPGSYGDVDTTGVTGTVVITATSGVTPTGTLQPYGIVRTGGILGVDGVEIDWSLDEGRKVSGPTPLHTATTYTYPNSEAGWTFAPSTTNAAYVALAVQLRAKVLAHLANVTAHDAADTSAALVSHVTNITAHDGPDLVAHTALALLVAATTTKEGIDLSIALKAIVNTHEGVALVAAGTGLLGSTASIASPTTYTAAADFLAGGVAAMDAQPRRPEFVIGGGGTPANMADSVTITGFDYALAAQTETGLSLTGLGTVKATKAFRGTGLACAFITADGTAATFTIGYSNGGHNSADVTNLVTVADPTYGTLVAGDFFSTRTVPPQWSVDDLYDPSDPDAITGAFAAIAECSESFGLLVVTEPVATGDVSTIVAGLDYLATFNKRPTLIVRFRDPDLDNDETDAAYIAAVRTWRAAWTDSRICPVAGNGWVTDAATGRRYFRSGLAALLARLQSFRTLPDERLAHSPACADDGPLDGFSIVDDAGHLIPGAHDEFVRGGIDGPVGAVGGALTFCYQRDEATKGTYVSRAPVAFAADDSVITLMDARVSSGIERELYSEAWTQIQGAKIVKTTTLDPDAALAMEQAMRGRIVGRYAKEIANPGDPNLVTVDPTVIVDPTSGEFTVHADVNDELFLYVGGVDIVVKNLRS